jgi:hypothetical protein
MQFQPRKGLFEALYLRAYLLAYLLDYSMPS